MTIHATSFPKVRAMNVSREVLLVVVIIGICFLFTFQSDYFLTQRNLVTVLRNSVDLAVISAGMTLVIIMGGIDVSVGGILAVAAIFIGRAYQAGLPDYLVVPIGLVVATLLGTVNGVIIAKIKVPAIIATLGSMYIFTAILFLVIGGTWIHGLPDTLSFLIRGDLFGIPVGIIIIACVYGLCWFLLRCQVWGRHLCGIGCDEHASRLVGINADRVKIQAYALLGALAGLAAVFYVARLRNVEVNIGTGIALEAIAATILGGANIRGGTGSLVGALLGVFFIKIVQNGLVLVGVSSLWETVVIGTLLTAVLGIDAMETSRTGRAA
ncbi:MAG: ABC transporter permease [Hyphomicrobiales bacterium]